MVHDGEEDDVLDARDAWMEEHGNINPTVAFMTPTFGQLMARGLRGARVTRGAREPGKPIKFKIPLPDNVAEACAAVRRHEAEEKARLNERPQIEGGQTGANRDWDNIRRQQDDAGYAGRGGMGVIRGPRGGRNGGAFRGRGAGRAQIQPFRAHHQAQRDQQLGQARGRGGARGFRGRGRGGDRARHGPGEQQQRPAQTLRGQGLKTQAQADRDPAIGTECKVCRGLDHLEMDCAKGSNLGSDSTWCMPHRGRVYENGPQECSGALDRCIGMMLKHERMEVAVVVRMVFDWITRNRSSRPEPRCVGVDWHWASCIAAYMEQNPEVEVTADMLPVRRHEVKEREKHKWGDPSLTWTNFDFKDMTKSLSIFQDPYWNTEGDRSKLIQRLRDYAASEPGQYTPPVKSKGTDTAAGSTRVMSEGTGHEDTEMDDEATVVQQNLNPTLDRELANSGPIPTPRQWHPRGKLTDEEEHQKMNDELDVYHGRTGASGPFEEDQGYSSAPESVAASQLNEWE